MNNCIISGMKTENKYKNEFIHPDVLDAAKALCIEENCGMRNALRYISLALAESNMQRFEQGDMPDDLS